MDVDVPNREAQGGYDVVQRECNGLVRLVAKLPNDRMNGTRDTVEEASCARRQPGRNLAQRNLHEPSIRLRMSPARDPDKPKPSVKNAVTAVPRKMTGRRPQLSA